MNLIHTLTSRYVFLGVDVCCGWWLCQEIGGSINSAYCVQIEENASSWHIWETVQTAATVLCVCVLRVRARLCVRVRVCVTCVYVCYACMRAPSTRTDTVNCNRRCEFTNLANNHYSFTARSVILVNLLLSMNRKARRKDWKKYYHK